MGTEDRLGLGGPFLPTRCHHHRPSSRSSSLISRTVGHLSLAGGYVRFMRPSVKPAQDVLAETAAVPDKRREKREKKRFELHEETTTREGEAGRGAPLPTFFKSDSRSKGKEDDYINGASLFH